MKRAKFVVLVTSIAIPTVAVLGGIAAAQTGIAPVWLGMAIGGLLGGALSVMAAAQGSSGR